MRGVADGGPRSEGDEGDFGGGHFGGVLGFVWEVEVEERIICSPTVVWRGVCMDVRYGHTLPTSCFRRYLYRAFVSSKSR